MGPTRPASGADIDAGAAVLARAFEEDPGTLVVEPDPDGRAAFLPGFFRSFVTASLADGGDVVVPTAGVNGIAIWFGPRQYSPRIETLLASGFAAALETLGAAGEARLVAMVGRLDAEHDRLMAGREHLRLEFLAVDPAAQGRGIGGSLLDAGHQRADELGVPSYLETFTLDNVRFYDKRGYRLLGQFHVGNNVPVYALERNPAAR